MAPKSRESDNAQAPTADDPACTTAFGGAARYVRAAWGLPDVVVRAPERRAPVSRRVAVALASLGVAAAVAAGAAVYHFACVVPSGVALSAQTFPDATLRQAVAAFDLDGNGRISVEEASGVTSLDLSGMGIRSLAGIGAFTHLESLDVSGNDLSEADLGGCTALRSLDVSDNAVASLDLTGLGALEVLDAHGNGMQTLDITDCSALRDLDVEGNALARLDLSGCASLERLNMDAGQEVTLPLASSFFPDAGLRDALAPADTDGDGALSARERQAVHVLTVGDAATASLEGLEWFDNLQELDVSGTQVSELGPDVLPASLTSLRAAGCALESVDLSSVERLSTLDLSDNPLTGVDVSMLTRLTWLDLSGCSLSGALSLTANTRLEHVDVSGNAGLAALDAQGVPGLAADGAVVADATCAVVLDGSADDAAAQQDGQADSTGAAQPDAQQAAAQDGGAAQLDAQAQP